MDKSGWQTAKFTCTLLGKRLGTASSWNNAEVRRPFCIGSAFLGKRASDGSNPAEEICMVPGIFRERQTNCSNDSIMYRGVGDPKHLVSHGQTQPKWSRTRRDGLTAIHLFTLVTILSFLADNKPVVAFSAISRGGSFPVATFARLLCSDWHTLPPTTNDLKPHSETTTVWEWD